MAGAASAPAAASPAASPGQATSGVGSVMTPNGWVYNATNSAPHAQGPLLSTPATGPNGAPTSAPVGMLSTDHAVDQVNQDKSYLDNNVPPPPPPAPPGQSSTPPSSKTPGSSSGGSSTTPTAQATYTNAAGQTASYSQDQLSDPSIQSFLSSNGYTLTNSNGVDPTAAKLTAGTNDATNQLQNMVTKFQSYNIDNDPAFATQVANIKAQYQQLLAVAQKQNDAKNAGLTTADLRNGTTQYAGNTASGIISSEMTAADARLADIVTKENDAIAAARTAYQNNQYSHFNEQITALKDLSSAKQTALTDYNNTIKAATTAAQTALNDQSKTSANILAIVKAGGTLTPAELATYDKNLGATGMAQAIYDGAKSTKQNADDLAFAKGLGQLPPGSTVTRNGITYTSTKVGNLTKVTEKAKDGTYTVAFFDPTKGGDPVSTYQGQAGDGSSSSSSSGGSKITNAATLRAATSSMNDYLDTLGKDENGKLSKEDWAAAYDKWHSVGGTLKQFVSAFSDRTNNAPGYNYLGMPVKAPKPAKAGS